MPAIIRRKLDFVSLCPVTGYVELDRRLVPIIDAVLPYLGNGKLFDSLGRYRLGIDKILALRTVICTSIRIIKSSARVGLKCTITIKILLDLFRQFAISAGIILDIRYIVQSGLAGPNIKGDGISDAIQQGSDGRKIPLDRAAIFRQGSSRRGFFVKIVGASPLIFKVTAGNRTSDRNGFVIRSSAPGNSASTSFSIGSHGVFNGLPGGIHAGKLIIDHRDGKPIFIGVGVDIKQIGYDLTGLSFDVTGSAVFHGNCGNAHEISNVVEDLSDCSVQSTGVTGVIIIISDAGRIGVPVLSRTLDPILGEIDHIVQIIVSAIAESKDTIEGSIVFITRCRSIISMQHSIIVFSMERIILRWPKSIGTTQESIPASALWINITIIIHILGRRAVGDEDDKGSILIRFAKLIHSLLQACIPVGALVISKCCRTIGAVRRKLAGDSRFSRCPRLSRVSVVVKGYQRHLDISAFILISEKVFGKIIDNLF